MPSGRARLAASSSLLGDKEKPEVTRHLNDTSVTDIYELGGVFATMRDVHYEVKCWNPLIKSTTLGRGSWDNGGNVASVGHLYGFGNTLDKALTGVVGCKERGRQVDGPLDHSLVARLERDGSKTTRVETDTPSLAEIFGVS